MPAPSLVEAIRAEATWSPGDLVQKFGSTGAVAAQLAGTRDRKSTAFKAAQRNVQRWLQGTRHPNKQTQQRLNQIGNKGESKKIHLDGEIWVRDRKYKRQRQIDIDFDEQQWEELTDLAMEGDEEALWDLVGEIYGPGYMGMESGDITFS